MSAPSASWDRLFGLLPEEVPPPIRYFVVLMIVRRRAGLPAGRT
jgi:hypothetical protein